MITKTVSDSDPAANLEKRHLPEQDNTLPNCLINIECQENQEKPGIDKLVTFVHSCENSPGSKPSKGEGLHEEDESSGFP